MDEDKARTILNLLIEKLNNFKKFVEEVAQDKSQIEHYKTMNEAQFLVFGHFYLVPNKKNLDDLTEKMSKKLSITDQNHKNKIKRYLECFVELLESQQQV
jgi:hypothetical protein